ncbi:MAG: KilA-N domain-containing protein [Clostridium sp.]|nr:KilA-N domain-containing protein [Clostridium sp.]
MKIHANGTEISVVSGNSADDYISLTDLARYRNPDDPAGVVGNWLRNRNTIDYLGLWEEMFNPNFKLLEFEEFKKHAGENAFTLSPQKWITQTNAIGLTSRSGRGGGTFAHKDIAFEFASWISPEFKLYVIKDYQRLKLEESKRLELGWDTKRELSKINYRIHTDAIKEFLITPELTKQEQNLAYANEADLLNIALFGKTAKQWRLETGNKKLNMRDFASVEQLIVLVNLESMNADMIRQDIPAPERLKKLRSVAYYQINSLVSNNSAKKLKATIENRLKEK